MLQLSRRDFSLAGLATTAMPLIFPATTACSRSLSREQAPNDSAYHSTLVSGLTPRLVLWNGREWRCDAGSTWHPGLDYCVRLTPNKARFELHDTPFDRGEADPVEKRRAELHFAKRPRLPNDVALWGAMSFIHQRWEDPSAMARAQGGVHGQIHIGSSFGGSPAVAFRRHASGAFRVTTRGEYETENKVRYESALTFDQVHDLVYRVVLSPTNGSLAVWLDRRKIVDVQGASIGSHYAESYWNIGCYYAGGIGCPVVAEYADHVYPDAAVLQSRIAAPPSWPAS
jgi:Polysaccharide lyase